ncbi:MAG TPA: FecR domain-containing protein [Candidatus Ozemobacteraceae bacterium]
MRRLWFVVFAFLFSFCMTAIALEEAGVVFSDLAGQVEVRPGDDEEAWEFAKMERKLYTDDHIKTGLDSSAILSFADMSTFVMKPSTEIILSSPTTKESKIILAAGNIWVNVKKMVKDGSMDIEMSQAVAGIKGTNITCSTNQDEDRIQVLRGIAEVLIRESQERVTVQEGEELIVKKGGKSEKVEINIQQEQDKWKEQLNRMGESIQMNEIPDTLRQIQQSESERFMVLQDTFKSLIAMESVPETAGREFIKEAERFTGVLMEDTVILSSIQLKVTNALNTPDLAADSRVRLIGYQKLIADARAVMQRYQNETAKMMRTQFKKGAGKTSLEEELQPVQESFNAVMEPVRGILQELSANPSGMGQDWFASALDACTQALANLDGLSEQVAAALEKNPSDAYALALQKQLNEQKSLISRMLKDLAVVEVDPSTITEMQNLEDSISDSILQLQTRINSYSAISGESLDVKKRQLAESLHILNNFSAARRNYLNSQRLYDSTMRAAASQKFRTAEQQELESQFERISNKFSELGIVAEQLELELNSLEDQINGILK